jgi:biopolymer transport protein ExbD
VLMGLNSIMTFGKVETELPPVNLPAVSTGGKAGHTAVNKVFITIRSGKNKKDKTYFYNDKEVDLWELMEILKKSKAPTVVLRGDRTVSYEWQEFCQLTWQLMKAGVKQISYATNMNGGEKS